MPYEINVSKNGKHYFATDKRSLSVREDAIINAFKLIGDITCEDNSKIEKYTFFINERVTTDGVYTSYSLYDSKPIFEYCDDEMHVLNIILDIALVEIKHKEFYVAL